jgi:hypothetical protein
MGLFQSKHETRESAVKKAEEISKSHGVACVILSKGLYYVEDDETQFIRNFETLIGVYKNGKKVKS